MPWDTPSPRRKRAISDFTPMRPSSNYYEEKSLVDVCGQGPTGAVTHSIFEDLRDDPDALKHAERLGSVALARQMPGPRDLDGRVGTIRGAENLSTISTRRK